MGRKARKKGLTKKKLQVLEKISEVQSKMRARESGVVRLQRPAEAISCKSF